MELFSYDVNGEPKISARFGGFFFGACVLSAGACTASLEKGVTY